MLLLVEHALNPPSFSLVHWRARRFSIKVGLFAGRRERDQIVSVYRKSHGVGVPYPLGAATIRSGDELPSKYRPAEEGSPRFPQASFPPLVSEP